MSQFSAAEWTAYGHDQLGSRYSPSWGDFANPTGRLRGGVRPSIARVVEGRHGVRATEDLITKFSGMW